MVSSKDQLSELRFQYDALKTLALDTHTYAHLVFDVAFELTSLDAAIAGTVETLIDGQKLSASQKTVLHDQIPLYETTWRLQNGTWVDLSTYPEIITYAHSLAAIRNAALRVVTTEE